MGQTVYGSLYYSRRETRHPGEDWRLAAADRRQAGGGEPSTGTQSSVHGSPLVDPGERPGRCHQFEDDEIREAARSARCRSPHEAHVLRLAIDELLQRRKDEQQYDTMLTDMLRTIKARRREDTGRIKEYDSEWGGDNTCGDDSSATGAGDVDRAASSTGRSTAQRPTPAAPAADDSSPDRHICGNCGYEWDGTTICTKCRQPQPDELQALADDAAAYLREICGPPPDAPSGSGDVLDQRVSKIQSRHYPKDEADAACEVLFPLVADLNADRHEAERELAEARRELTEMTKSRDWSHGAADACAHELEQAERERDEAVKRRNWSLSFQAEIEHERDEALAKLAQAEAGWARAVEATTEASRTALDGSR
jgi:hypothetical protein